MGTWVSFETTEIGGLSVCTASRDGLARAAIADCISAKSHASDLGPRIVFDANGHAISLHSYSGRFRQAMAHAHVIHADGGFIVSLSRWLGSRRIKERSATTDLIHDIAKRAETSGVSFFILGGSEDVNSQCVERLRELYPDLSVPGRRNGYFALDEEGAIVDYINASGADILWVGLGKPLEQEFCARNRHRLKCAWIVTCGGCYNYITGSYRRAPKWMQQTNIEWLHRMATNPRKLFFRYLTTSPHAVWVVLKHAIIKKMRRGAP